MTSQPETSRTIGRYEVLGELGRGAMGVVLLARDPVLDREVAIKYLRPDLRLEPHERETLIVRMRQEAKAIARVSHRGLVHVHDIGETDTEGVYLVVERVDGPTLESVLRRGRLTADATARLAREVGDGLSAAHQRSIVHRDIKPGNILLTDEGAKVTDFGVARLPDSTLTKAGVSVGTPAYSAPEALSRGVHSPESDQFSLAATAYEALSGRRPFPGDDAVTVARQIQKDTPLPVAKGLGLPPAVDSVILRGLAKEASDRFPSASLFGAALADALTGGREIQLTLPDQRTLPGPKSYVDLYRPRSHHVGRILLWVLVGATITALAYRIRSQGPLVGPQAGPTPELLQPEPRRPAYMTPSSPSR